MLKTAAALALSASLGAAAAMSAAALLREAPGAKTYFVHKLDVAQTALEDGGSNVTATAYTTVTLDLSDGGTAVHDMGGVPCPLSAARQTTLRNILVAAEACAQNAP